MICQSHTTWVRTHTQVSLEQKISSLPLSSYPQLYFANTSPYYLLAQSTLRILEREFEKKEYDKFPSDGFKSLEESQSSFDEGGKKYIYIADVLGQILSDLNRLADKAYYSFMQHSLMNPQKMAL